MATDPAIRKPYQQWHLASDVSFERTRCGRSSRGMSESREDVADIPSKTLCHRCFPWLSDAPQKGKT